ncbi:MAG TPA: ribonuclease P protein component [Chitinophagales bacterium]|nr:ribonuclease P protein component [Chitinophagales bacterium]
MEEKFLHAEGPGAERNLPFQTKGVLNNASAANNVARFDLAKYGNKSNFGKDEKLKSTKLIEQLFKEGKSVKQGGVTLVYLFSPLNTFYPAQAGFSVSKKHFKHAVDRNRVKRLMREAYRLNKTSLYQYLKEAGQQLAIMWVYNGKQLPEMAQVEKSLTGCLKKITKP